MRAVRTRRPGSIDGLETIDLAVPAPRAGELLIRVHATSVTRGDVVLRKLPSMVVRLFGEKPKRVLGHEFAGTVVSVGDDAVGFAPGCRVFGTTSGTEHGAHAEYLIVGAEGMIVEIPDHIAFDEAAPVPVGAMTAFHFLEEAGVGQDLSVLVNGASGSVGSFAVQIAHARGARVTGVCSARNAPAVLGLGAEDVIDHTTTDATALARSFDVVFDAVGTLRARAVRRILSDGGRFTTVRTRRDETLDELMAVRDLLAAGVLHAVIDREYELADIAGAHAHVESGHKRGNVLVRVRDPQGSDS